MAFFRKKAQPAPENLAPSEGLQPGKLSEAMGSVNAYHRELTSEEIAKGQHRHFVGARWDEVGRLQLEGLKQHGLKPTHKLCDAGCGSLRGGIHFVDYLDAGNYFGFDINQSLIDGGQKELEKAGLTGKNAHLLVSDRFEMARFGATFDFIIAFSLFTHLHANYIVRCLVEARKAIAPDGQFLATFFHAPTPAHIEPIDRKLGGLTTYYDHDPFHYSTEEMSFLANLAGFKAEVLPVRENPGAQRGIVFLPV